MGLELNGSLIEASQFLSMLERIDRIPKPDYGVLPAKNYLANLREWFVSMLNMIGQEKEVGYCTRLDEFVEYPKVSWKQELFTDIPLDINYLYRIDISGLYPSIIGYALLNKSDEEEKAFQEAAGISRKVEFGWNNLREFFLTTLHHKQVIKEKYNHLWTTTKMILNGMYGMAGKYTCITAPGMGFVTSIVKKWVHNPILLTTKWSAVMIDVDTMVVSTAHSHIHGKEMIEDEINKILSWYNTPILQPKFTVTHMATEMDSFVMHRIRSFDFTTKDGKLHKNIRYPWIKESVHRHQ